MAPMTEYLRPADLAGKLTLTIADSAHAFTRNQVIMRVEQDLRPVCTGYASTLVVTKTMLDDGAMLRAVVEERLLRALRPWLDPDRNPFPTVTPFPRLARLERLVARWRAELHVVRFRARARIRRA